MRKFFFSMKTLALTLALVVGGSAWAQITSLPFVADFSESTAPFGEPAKVAGNDAIGKVVSIVSGTAEATFALDGGAYALGNSEEVTVSFTMYNGWVDKGGANTFAVLNSDGVALASITYDNLACNVTDVTLAGSTAEDFVAFAGQGTVGSKGSNGYDNNKNQGYIANTETAKNNGVVTIKINSNGTVSLSFVGGKGNVNNTYSATVAEGTKLDLAKLTISNVNSNEDRATGYGDLTVTVEEIVPEVPFDPVDCTSKVGTDAWKSDIGNVGNYTKDVAQKEQYKDGAEATTVLGEVLYQTVEGLENGTYTVELYANASYTEGRGFATDADKGDLGRVVVYAGDVEKTIPVIYQTAVGTNNIVTIENVVVSDGTLKMGLRKNIAGSNWHTIQIKSLIQVSDKAKADVNAENAYWKEIATAVVEANANVGGVEKANLVGAKTKAAVQEAITPFYSGRASYNALANAIKDAEDAGFDVSEYNDILTNAKTTAESAAAAVHALKLAVNTKAVEGASKENPILTDFVVNGTFDTTTSPWITTTGAQNRGLASNQQGAFTGSFFENWNPNNFSGKIYQVIEDIPNGNYTLNIAAFVSKYDEDGHSQYVYANDTKVQLTTGEPTAYKVDFEVTNNTVEIGLEQLEAVNNWFGIDNVSLTYYGSDEVVPVETVNADINFNNPIVDGKVVGKVNEIVIPEGAGEIRGESGWLSLYDGTSTVTIPEDERANAVDAVNVQFKMAWGNKKDMGSGFTLKDAEGEPVVSFQLARWCENGTNGNTLGIDDIYDHIGAHNGNTPISDRYTLFDITVDYATRKVTTVLTCMNPANTATYVADLTNTNPIATFNLYGYNVGGNTDRASVVDDILIKTIEGNADVTYADYTVKFVDQNGDQVKEPVVRNNIVGQPVEVKAEEKETIIEGNAKYVYVSDDAEGKTIAEDGSTVVTVKFRKIVVSEYTVNYLDAKGNVLQEATTHKEIETGTEVSASAGELSKILVEGIIYSYASGNNAITVAEDASKNVINLVFASVEGVTGYYLATYEDGKTPWTTTVGGRFDPTVVNGNAVPSHFGTKVVQEPVVDEEGNPVLDEENNPTYKDVIVTDSTVVIEFANKTKFASVAQGTRNNNGAANNLASLGIDQADYTIEARLMLGSSNDQTGTNFLVKNLTGDANILAVQQIAEKGTTTWTINGETTVVLPNSGSYTGGDINNYANYSWYDFKVTVYKGYTFVTITDAEGNAILDKEQVATSAVTYGVGALQFNSSRYYANFGIDDMLVRSVADEDVPAGFSTVAVTINYVDADGKTLKSSDTVEFGAGTEISLSSVYTSDFKVDAEGAVWTAESESAPVTKYIYVSDSSEGVIAEEGASVNVVFRGVASRRVAMRYQYQDAETGEMMTKDAAGANLAFFYDSRESGDVLFEGDVQRVYYPYYLLVDGYLYKTGANGGDADHYDYTVPAGTSTLSLSPVTWTPATEMVGEEGEEEEVFITNAVFAEESENIPGMTVVKDQYTKIRQANGAAGSAIGGDVYVTTLMPGKYTVTTASRSGTTNILVDGNVVCTVSTSGTVTTVTGEEFEVTKPTPVYVAEQATTSQYSDYILIRKTGDVEDASYVVLSNYALACDGAYDEDDAVTVVVTYDAEIVGSYAESFMLNADFAYTVTDAEGKEVTSGSKNPFEVSAGTLNIYVSNLQPETEYTITITGVEVTDFDMDIFDFVTVYTEEGTLATLTFKTGTPTGIANVEAAPAVKADGKYLENGQIVIYRGGVKYNAAGAVIR